jgi:hypothetical protein
VPAITGGANRERPGTRPARAQPERRVHEALAQSSRPRNAGTAAVAQSPTADATGRTVESANEGPERQLWVLTSSQSPSTIEDSGGRWTLPGPQPVIVFSSIQERSRPRDGTDGAQFRFPRYGKHRQEQQTALLTRLADDENHAAGDAVGVQFFRAIKSMTISGYYATEIGLRQELGDDGQLMLLEFHGCDHPEHQA